ESIEHNGFYGVVVVQRSTGYILAGNHRYLAARHAGATEIPVAWVDVDDDEALRILLADNRTNDLASYDNHALAELLQGLMTETGTLDGTGYGGDALDELLADLEPTLPEPGDAPVEDTPEKFQVVVTCLTEADQLRLLDELTARGYKCQALVL